MLFFVLTASCGVIGRQVKLLQQIRKLLSLAMSYNVCLVSLCA